MSIARALKRDLDTILGRVGRDFLPSAAANRFPMGMMGGNDFGRSLDHWDRMVGDRDFELVEKKDKYYLNLDIPGVRKEDVTVSVSKDRRLRVESERKNSIMEGGTTVESEKEDEESAKTTDSEDNVVDSSHSRSVLFGRTVFTYTLPDDVDGDNIHAAHENGVLTLLMPKKPVDTEQKIIPIE